MEERKLPDIKILDEKEKIIHKVSKEVTFPLDDETKKLIDDVIEFLEMSQIDEYIEKYELRPGWGLAFPQMGILKRIFVLAEETEEEKFNVYVVINPEVVSKSEEMVYIAEGEGCLSVNRPTTGIVPRHARMTVKAYDVDGNPYTIRVREELAVGFQHEMDHLDGILFVDKIDKKDPFKNQDKYRAI